MLDTSRGHLRQQEWIPTSASQQLAYAKKEVRRPERELLQLTNLENHMKDMKLEMREAAGTLSSVYGQEKGTRVPQSTAKVHEQRTGALDLEGTIFADSGFASVSGSRSVKDPKSHDGLREYKIMKMPETQSRPTMEQQIGCASSFRFHGSDYVNRLCNDIHGQLRDDLWEHAYDRAPAKLPRCLPDLIKAFSIRIGHEASEPSGVYAMYFLHKHCKDIVAQLHALCQQPEKSPEISHRNTDDEETEVMERITLWTRKQNVDPAPEPKRDSLFERIGDIDDEHIQVAGNARIATYREFISRNTSAFQGSDFISSSTSYQWFIGSLKKELSLDWGSDDLTEAWSCRPIYHSILSGIPSGINSGQRTLKIHRARSQFGIQMHPDVVRFLATGPIADLMTLTSSAPNIVQALPMKNYLKQTWSSGGLMLAEIIQKACDGVHTDHFDDNTRIAAQLVRLEHSHFFKLLVTVSGSRYSISECGEQLAWLCAAFQRSIGRRGIHGCTCRISREENEWSIQYSVDQFRQDVSPSNVLVAQRLCDATIIQGFPTKKRPPLFHGLELGLDRMLDCVGTSWPPVFENDRTVLKGPYHKLELAKRTQNVFLWHVVHPGSRACSFSECPSRDEHHMPSIAHVLHKENVARGNRHIIANLEYLGIPIVGLESHIDNEMGQASAQTVIQSIETQEEIDPALSPMEYRSSATDSSEDSLDSDILSISSGDSDYVHGPDLEGPLALIINQLSHRLFAEYKESRSFRSILQLAPTGIGERGGNSGKSGTSGSSTNQSASFVPPHLDGVEVRRSGKRSRPNDEEESDDRDDGGSRRPPRPTKRPTASPNRPLFRILACPFWKLDCQTHRNCFRVKCSRIGDVKYHLHRKHRQPASDYCQRCWVAFENEAHKVTHLSDESDQRCKYDPAARPVGIDNSMAAALHKKSNPKQSTECQWFAIWEIVFPGRPRPSSPYIDDSLTEDATQLQELIVDRWPSILATELEAWELAASENLNKVGREYLIRETLARLSDDFSAEQARMRAVRAPAGHQSPDGETSSSSIRADSAIELGSCQSPRHSSAGPTKETTRSNPGLVGPPLETHPPARSQSCVRRNGRARFILPRGQNSFNVNNGLHPMPMPPQNASPGAMLHDSPDTQTMDIYGADHSFGDGLTNSDLFPRLTEDFTSQSFVGRGELDINASFESMEALTDFDWPSFES